MQAAIRFVLMHEGVTTILGGFSSVEQMVEILKAAGALAFPAGLMARIQDALAANFGEPSERQGRREIAQPVVA